MKWLRTRAIRLLLCAAPSALLGCGPQRPNIDYYLSSRADLQRIRRVVFVDLSQESSFPAISDDMSEALFQALQGGNFFHIDRIARDDPHCRDLPLDARQAFTVKDLAAMREAFGCDALLFGRVSHFRSYPRMQIGLFLRLLDLKEGKLVWGVENIWDTTDKTIENRAKEFYEKQMRSGYEPAEWSLLMKSPKAFQKFVAFEVAGTLTYERRQAGRKPGIFGI